jgi:dTDP-4-amino-4,6-dideoxygalactose transaminase
VHTQFSSRSKEEIVKAMAAENIPSAPTYTSIIYNQPWIQDRAIFAKSGIPWSLAPQGVQYDYTHACPNAEQALADHILISLNESVSKETLSRVALAMKRIESAYR